MVVEEMMTADVVIQMGMEFATLWINVPAKRIPIPMETGFLIAMMRMNDNNLKSIT
jgi:hypothetical protein